MIILAIDAATETGCCDGSINGQPRLWTWSLRDAGDSRPARLAMLWRFLDTYFVQEECDAVVYEAPMPIGAIASIRGVSEANVAFLRGAVGVIEMTCHCYEKPVQGVSVQNARQSVLSWRRNTSDEKTKDRVMREVKIFGADPANDNEADAFVLWRHACNLQNPRLAVACTPLFR